MTDNFDSSEIGKFFEKMFRGRPDLLPKLDFINRDAELQELTAINMKCTIITQLGDLISSSYIPEYAKKVIQEEIDHLLKLKTKEITELKKYY